MGWSFRVTCPDCVHVWEGIQTSYRFGYWSELADLAIDDGFRSWFCPRCYYLLRIPRASERNVWRKWYAAFLAGPDAECAFLLDVAAKLDEVLSRGKLYTPIPVELEPVECPECHQPFEECIAGVPDRLVCPRCQGTGAVLESFESHCQVFRDRHGFS